jgi:sugar O-acyltransferase (sialic acid O-acetyltransferase NeuD family)
VIENDSEYNVCAFCVVDEFKQSKTEFGGLPLVSFEEVGHIYPPKEYKMFIAVGDNELRSLLFEEAKKKGFQLLSYVSKRANTWADLDYGSNVFISDDTVIHPFITIGDGCIIFGSRVGHHSQLGKFNLLSHCVLAGSVTVGDFCFFGVNSAVKQGVQIEDRCLIGMSCVIDRNIGMNEVYSVKGTTKKSEVSYERFKRKYLR